VDSLGADFDDFLARDHLDRQVAEKLHEEQSQLFRLQRAEDRLRLAVMPDDAGGFLFDP
jgi:hypothetical protein